MELKLPPFRNAVVAQVLQQAPNLRGCGRLVRRLYVDCHWVVVAVIDIYDSASNQAGISLCVDVDGKGEWAEVGVLLHELDFPDEE